MSPRAMLRPAFPKAPSLAFATAPALSYGARERPVRAEAPREARRQAMAGHATKLSAKAVWSEACAGNVFSRKCRWTSLRYNYNAASQLVISCTGRYRQASTGANGKPVRGLHPRGIPNKVVKRCRAASFVSICRQKPKRGTTLSRSFTKNSGWQVDAKIRPEHLDIQFASVAGP
jgi:hypothetical protein